MRLDCPATVREEVDAKKIFRAIDVEYNQGSTREMIAKILGWASLLGGITPIIYDVGKQMFMGGSLNTPPEHIGVGIAGTGIGMICLAIKNHIGEGLDATERMYYRGREVS